MAVIQHNLPKNQEKLPNLTKKIYNKFSNELVKEPLKTFKMKLFDWLELKPIDSLQIFLILYIYISFRLALVRCRLFNLPM